MQSKVLRICVNSRYARDETSVNSYFSANQTGSWTGHGHSLTLADDPLSQIFFDAETKRVVLDDR